MSPLDELEGLAEEMDEAISLVLLPPDGLDWPTRIRTAVSRVRDEAPRPDRCWLSEQDAKALEGLAREVAITFGKPERKRLAQLIFGVVDRARARCRKDSR